MIWGWSAAPHGLTGYQTLGSASSRSLALSDCLLGPQGLALGSTRW